MSESVLDSHRKGTKANLENSDIIATFEHPSRQGDNSTLLRLGPSFSNNISPPPNPDPQAITPPLSPSFSDPPEPNFFKEQSRSPRSFDYHTIPREHAHSPPLHGETRSSCRDNHQPPSLVLQAFNQHPHEHPLTWYNSSLISQLVVAKLSNASAAGMEIWSCPHDQPL